MSDLVYHRNYQVHVNLTAEEEALILSARPGQTLDMPRGPIQYYQEKFEDKTKDSLSDRMSFFAGHSIIFCGTLALTASHLFHSSYITALATSVVGLAFNASLGHAEHRSRERTVRYEANDIDDPIHDFVHAVKNGAQRASQINLVRDIDRKVSQGEKLTLAELGQLVNVNTAHFREASEALAITVLSAKAVIAMQDKKIMGYTVANSSDRSFMNGANSDLILLKLWDQHAKQIDIATEIESEPEVADLSAIKATLNMPHNITSTFAKVTKFYKTGLQRAWESIRGNAPKAADYLTPVARSFTVPEIEITADIGDRLRNYGLEFLDLPALEPLPFK